MRNAELLIIFVTLAAYIVPFFGAGALVWWVSTRSSRSRERGMLRLTEGRVLEAYELFDHCNDKLVLRGQASLWLWRLDTARHELDSAATLFEGRDEAKAAPFLAAVAALRGDRDAETWVMASGARLLEASTEARLGLAVMQLRRGRPEEALAALPRSAENPRARALVEIVRALAQTKLDGTSRPVDAAAMLGEGSIVELKRAWPELAQVLEAGTT